MTNCTFTNNSAPAGSGAIYMNFGSVENCNFADNTANNGDGGAIEISEGSVENCNFTNCSAGYGGAVSVSGNGNVTNCNLYTYRFIVKID